MSEDNPMNNDPIQSGVEHGPYLPMDPEEEAALAGVVEEHTGYAPQPEDSQLLQEAHQLEEHQDAITRAEDQGHIDLETGAVMHHNVERPIMDIEHEFENKASDQTDAARAEAEAYQPEVIESLPDDDPSREQSMADVDPAEVVSLGQPEVEAGLEEESSNETDEPSEETHEKSSLPETDSGLLALSVIDRRLAAAREELARAQSHLAFVSSYSGPSRPGPRPASDAGGMDHQDWNEARLAYAQYDEEGEENDAYERLDQAENAVEFLEDDRQQVLSGDEDTIGEIVAAERARLDEEKRKVERAEERKTGKEFEGSHELFEALQSLEENASLKEIEYKEGPNGWAYIHVRPHGASKGLVFEMGRKQGPMKQFIKKLEIVPGEESVSVRLHEIPKDSYGRPTTMGGDGYAENTDYTFMSVTKEGLVRNQSHYHGHTTQDSRLSPLRTPTPSSTSYSKELDFTQADFDKVKGMVEAIKADLSSLREGSEQSAEA